ncbi:MAG: hypothetical protein JJU20_01680 [Opitutales bacterium]|nr:hypothetical protein [Opitutales bacterium]
MKSTCFAKVWLFPLITGLSVSFGSTLAADDDWDALMDEFRETEGLLNAWEREAYAEPVSPSGWQHSVDLAPLLGWTDNLLRSRDRVSSAYTGLQLDGFLLGFPDAQTRVTGFLLADYRVYSADVEVDSETMVVAGLEWLRQPQDWGWLAAVDLYYGDHLFELFEQDIGVPVDSERFRQHQVGGRVGLRRALGQQQELRFEISAYRNWFGESFYDYDEGRARLDHRIQVTPKLRWVSYYQFGNERYSELVPRDANGSFLLDRSLLVQRHLLAVEPNWTLTRDEALSLRVTLSHEWFEDVHGAYNQRRQARLRPSLVWRLDAWEHRLNLEFSSVQYAHRPASLLDQRRLKQERWAASYAATYWFSERHSAALQYAFTEVDSLRSSDVYSRHQLEGHWRFYF